MSNIYKLNETANFEFIFLDVNTQQPIDINTPTYTIVYVTVASDLTLSETIIVPTSALTRIDVGEYAASWTIPSNVPANINYFIRATGFHPISNTSTVLEESFKIVTSDYFSQESNLVIKFTKD